MPGYSPRSPVFDFHPRLGPAPDAADRLLSTMEKTGVDQAAVSAGGVIDLDQLAAQILTGSHSEADPDNDAVLAACRRSGGRLVPFYFANPYRDPDRYRLAAPNFRGLELSPAVHGIGFDDPRLVTLVGLAARFAHPVYVVCLGRPGTTAADLARLAARFPAVTFVFGHCGFTGIDTYGLSQIAGAPNIMAETSGCLTIVAARAIALLGPGRVLFGTEHPLQHPSVELAKFDALDLDPPVWRQIAWGNARRLLSREGDDMTTNPTTIRCTAPARPQLGQWHDLAELGSLQDEQLRLALARAAISPFYRSRLGEAMPADRAELGRIPLTTKQDLRHAYPFGMLAVGRNQLATYHESSGTAGEPTASYYTEADWGDLAERYARKWVGIDASDMFFVRTPYALMITGHLAHAAARLHQATVVPGDNRSLAMPYGRVVRVLHDLEVTLTWSLPTETLLWAAAARAAGYRPDKDFPALRALFVGGEPLSRARRERIAAIWGVPVVEEYGSTETGTLAGACPEGVLHLWSDRALFEVYDAATGTTGPHGRGQLVVTPFYREAMPLLRYNLGDEVEISYEPCGCGWVLPTVRVLGRSAFGYPCGGALVTQARLEELVFSLPAGFEVLFWRARAEPALLRVHLEVAAEHRDAACAALTAAIRDDYGIDAEVTGLPPGELVPLELLTRSRDVVKPRSLFGPDEDWGSGLLYH